MPKYRIEYGGSTWRVESDVELDESQLESLAEQVRGGKYGVPKDQAAVRDARSYAAPEKKKTYKAVIQSAASAATTGANVGSAVARANANPGKTSELANLAARQVPGGKLPARERINEANRKEAARKMGPDETFQTLDKIGKDIVEKTTNLVPSLDKIPGGRILQGIAPAIVGPGDKGYAGHVAGLVGGTAAAPFDIAADVVKFTSKGEWQAAANILLKTGAAALPLKGAAPAIAKVAGKTKAGRSLAVGRAMKETVQSGIGRIDPNLAAQTVGALIRAGATEDEAIQAVGAAIRTNEAGIAETVGKTRVGKATSEETRRVKDWGEFTPEQQEIMKKRMEGGVSLGDRFHLMDFGNGAQGAGKSYEVVRFVKTKKGEDYVILKTDDGKFEQSVSLSALEDTRRPYNERRSGMSGFWASEANDWEFTDVPRKADEPGVAELAGKGRVVKDGKVGSPVNKLYRAVDSAGRTPDEWVYTTESKDYADYFAEVREGSVVEHSRSLAKPLDLTNVPANGTAAAFKKALESNGIKLPKLSPGEPLWQLQQPEVRRAILEQGRAQGFDGVIFNDLVIRPDGKKIKGKSHIFFDNATTPTSEAVPTPLPVDDVRPVQIDSNVKGSVGEAKGNAQTGAKEPWQMTREEFAQPQAYKKVSESSTAMTPANAFTGDVVRLRASLPGDIKGAGFNADEVVSRYSNKQALWEAANDLVASGRFDDGLISKLKAVKRAAEKAGARNPGKHVSIIEKALKEGKPVPAEVIRDYPDLAEKYNVSIPSQTTARYGANYGTPVQASGKRPGYAMERPAVTPPVEPPPVKPVEPKTVAKAEPSPEVTSVSNRGFEENPNIDAPKGQGQSAKKLIDDADIDAEGALDLSRRIQDGSAAFNPENAAKVQTGVAKLQRKVNEYADLMDEADAKGDAAGYQRYREQYEAARANLQEFAENVQKGKSEWSDVGRILAAGVDENGDFAAMQQSYARAKGVKVEKLTNKETAMLKGFADEYNRMTKEIEDLKAQVNGQRAADAVERGRRSRRTVDPEALKVRKAEAAKAISEEVQKILTAPVAGILGAGGPGGGAVNFGRLGKAIRDYADVLVTEGVQGLDNVVQAIREAFPVLERQQIVNMLAESEKRTKGELEAALTKARNELKREAKKASDVGQGKQADKAARTMEAKRKADAARKAKQDAIEADRLEREGKRAEAKKLRDDMRQRAKEQDELDREAKRLDEAAAREQQKPFNRETELRGQISELERKIAEGDFAVKSKPEMVKSKRILELEEKRDTIRSQYQAMRERAKPKTIPKKIDSFFAGNQLLQPIARLVDVVANTAKITSHIATSPLRTGISAGVDKIAGTKGAGYQGSLWRPSKYARALSGSGIRIKEAFKRAWSGGDMDSIAKYGTGNVITRVTGMTDVPFKEFYTRMALDDLAWAEARSQTKDKAKQRLIAEELLAKPTKEMALAAEDWALRNTFNSDNLVSSLISGAKESAARQVGKEWGETGADTVRLLTNVITRFSKVIGNVALERANYVPELGLGEAALRLSKRAKAPLSAQESRLVSDLATKGLTGMALTTAGGFMYANGWLRPEIKKTKNGTVYADWGVYEQVGSILAPTMYGATLAAAEDLEQRGVITKSQKEKFVWNTAIGLLTNQPAISTPKAALQGLQSGDSAAKFAGRMLASGTIPGVVRVTANALDPKEGEPWWLAAIEEGRDVDSKGFWDEFKKRVPKLRNTLPTKPTQTLLERSPNPVGGKR